MIPEIRKFLFIYLSNTLYVAQNNNIDWWANLDVFLGLWLEIEHFFKELQPEMLICTGLLIELIITCSQFC
jgi:hypothetical protein